MAVNPEDAALFIGSRTLLSYERRLASGTVEKPLGEHPRGRIPYLKNGQMSAQVTGSEFDSLAHEDPGGATPDEAGRACRNSVGYWGNCAVDAAAGVVTHTVEGAWFPNRVGRQQVRKRLAGDQPTLEAGTPAWHATLAWQRIE